MLSCVCLCVFKSMSLHDAFCLVCVCVCVATAPCVAVTQVHVWLELCMCVFVLVFVCSADGMGCMFTGLPSRAGWQPAETMGLENGVCLCVPLLSQRETRQLSPLAPFRFLSHSLALFPAHSHFFFLFLSILLISFSTSVIIFSLHSPLLMPALLMFSCHISYRSYFLCINLFPCCFLFFWLLFEFPLSHHQLCRFHHKCVSNWT